MTAVSTVIFPSSGNKNLNGLLLCPKRKFCCSEEKEVRLQIDWIPRMGKGEVCFQDPGGAVAAAQHMWSLHVPIFLCIEILKVFLFEH